MKRLSFVFLFMTAFVVQCADKYGNETSFGSDDGDEIFQFALLSDAWVRFEGGAAESSDIDFGSGGAWSGAGGIELPPAVHGSSTIDFGSGGGYSAVDFAELYAAADAGSAAAAGTVTARPGDDGMNQDDLQSIQKGMDHLVGGFDSLVIEEDDVGVIKAINILIKNLTTELQSDLSEKDKKIITDHLKQARAYRDCHQDLLQQELLLNQELNDAVADADFVPLNKQLDDLDEEISSVEVSVDKLNNAFLKRKKKRFGKNKKNFSNSGGGAGK